MQPHELMQAQRALRLTCEELAETLSVAECTVRQWRCGRYPIAHDAADRINALLSMPEREREQHIFRRKVRYRRAA
jgi:DNA-binding transcriptional regulator YiaG